MATELPILGLGKGIKAGAARAQHQSFSATQAKMKTFSAILVCALISAVLASAIDGDPTLKLETLQEPSLNRQARSFGIEKGREKELELHSKYGSSVKYTKKKLYNDGGAITHLPTLLDSYATTKERIIKALHSKKGHTVPIVVQPVQPAPAVVQPVQPAPAVVQYQAIQPVVQYQPVQEVIDYQPVHEVIDYQPVQQVIDYQPVQQLVEYQPVQQLVQVQPAQQLVQVQPAHYAHPVHHHLLSHLLKGHNKHFGRDSRDAAEDETANDTRGAGETLDNDAHKKDASGPA